MLRLFLKICELYIWCCFRHGINKLSKTQLVVLFLSCVSFVMVCSVMLCTTESSLFSVKNNLMIFFFCLGRYLWPWFYKTALWNWENRYSSSFCSPNTCRWALLHVLILFAVTIFVWNMYFFFSLHIKQGDSLSLRTMWFKIWWHL